MNNILGVPIVASTMAVTKRANRIHKKRRSQSAAYHLRIQKKWNKRFGFHHIPCAYMVTDPWTGRQSYVMHPTLVAKLPKGPMP